MKGARLYEEYVLSNLERTNGAGIYGYNGRKTDPAELRSEVTPHSSLRGDGTATRSQSPETPENDRMLIG